jgi:rubredoxin
MVESLPQEKNSYAGRKNRSKTFHKKELQGNMPADEKNARWVCLECHYIYDPARGDPKNGIPAGTPWNEVPDTWRCPECKILKAKKGVFRRLED